MLEAGTWNAYRANELLKPESLDIGPNSVDVSLHRKLLKPRVLGPTNVVDPYDGQNLEWDTVEIDRTWGYVLQPNEFLLGAARERFDCRNSVLMLNTYQYHYFAPMYDGRSTCGRIGIASHITAGFGDYGFCGAFTLEIKNNFPYPIRLREGMRIGQVYFDEVSSAESEFIYHGAYSHTNHNDGPVPPVLGRERFECSRSTSRFVFSTTSQPSPSRKSDSPSPATQE
jgi:deoxycytidine triphosphate deaminase